MGFWEDWAKIADSVAESNRIAAERRQEWMEEWRIRGEENTSLRTRGLRDGEKMYVYEGWAANPQKTFVRRGNAVYIYDDAYHHKRTVFVSSSEEGKNMTIYDGPGITPYSPIPFQTTVVKSESGCFVATAIYGNSEAPQVQALRDFKDNVLMRHPLGRRFVDFYYSGAGKRVAYFISEHLPSAIPLIRKGLDALVDSYTAQRK